MTLNSKSNISDYLRSFIPEKQRIVPLWKLEPADVWQFALKDETVTRLSKYLRKNFLAAVSANTRELWVGDIGVSQAV